MTCGKMAGLRFLLRRGLPALLLAGLLSPCAGAAVPQRLNYQGKLASAAGDPLTGTYSFRFKLFAAETGGAALFSEDVTGGNAVSVANGIYTVQIGSYTAGGIPYGVFDGQDLYLEIDVQAGSALSSPETLSPRERLNSAAWAVHALGAERLGTGAVVSTHTASGDLLIARNVVASSGMITGNYFSVGGSTLVATDGNVGIGMSSPGTRLDVAGVIRGSTVTVTQNIVMPDAASNAAGNIFFGGDTTATRSGLRLFGGVVNGGSSEGGGYIDAVSTSGAGGLLFRVDSDKASTERMRINTAGRVGIGTLSPAARLHVSSAGAAAADTLLLVSSGASTGQELAAVKGDGRVGVGTASPAFKLEVAGVAPSSASAITVNRNLFLQDDGAGTAHLAHNAFQTSDWNIADPAKRASTIELRNFSNASLGSIDMYVTQTAGAIDWKRMLSITSHTVALAEFGGSVGVGTSSPAAKLDLADAGTAVDLATVQSLPTGANAGFRYAFRAGLEGLTGNSAVAFGGRMNASNLAGQYLLYGYRSNDGVMTAGIKGSGDAYFGGKVGVGTTAPASPLSVSGNAYIINGSLGFNRDPADGSLPPGGDASRGRYQMTPFGDRMQFETYSSAGAGTGIVVISTTGGRVGVGTATPGAQVHVVGEVRTTDASNNPRVWGQGRPGAVRYGTTGAGTGLCANGAVVFGLSGARVRWEGSAAACPAGTWVCTQAERGSAACDTAWPTTTCDFRSGAGVCTDQPDSQAWGHVADASFQSGREGNHINESGSIGGGGDGQYEMPVWCCSN